MGLYIIEWKVVNSDCGGLGAWGNCVRELVKGVDTLTH